MFDWLGTDVFMPHGFCLQWNPQLVGLLVASNIIIAFAYYSIPFSLFYFVNQRQKLQFGWVFLLFGAFIFLCGTTHVMNIVTIWQGSYWLAAIVDALTAAVSIVTAITLWTLVPKFLAVFDRYQRMDSARMPPPTVAVSVRRWITGCLTLGSIAVFAVGVVLYQQSQSMIEARNSLIHTETVLNDLGKVVSSMKDAETGERGFIITGDEEYLEPYRMAKQTIPFSLATLVQSTSDSTADHDVVMKLKKLITAKFQQMQNAIEHRNTGGFEAASHVIEAGQGKTIMNQIRQLNQSIESHETDILQAQTALLDSRTKQFVVTFIWLAIGAIAVFCGFAFFISLYLTELNIAHELVSNQKNRLEEFYAILAHELRSPLTSIRGSLGLVAGGICGAMPDQAKELITISQSETERMLRLINELLDIKKIEEGKFDLVLALVLPSQVISKTLEGLQGMAHMAEIKLVKQIKADTPVSCDEDKIVQVLTNLISNAIKFSTPNTSVEVSVDAGLAEIRFSVRDHGPGIPEDQRDKLFQKFHQIEGTRSAHKGTGLGLAISKSITELHGGNIGFDSQPGIGTTFWFCLPAVDSGSEVKLIEHLA